MNNNTPPHADAKSVAEYVLGQFLSRYEPWSPESGKAAVHDTSAEIASMLSDVAEVSISDVANAMAARGFQIGYDTAGRIAWCMAYKD